MNTYDFDKKIFYPDSSVTFVKYCTRRYPGIVIGNIPKVIGTAAAHLLGRADTKALKEKLFAFLAKLPDVDAVVDDFWKENRQRIGQWYLEQKREDDLIISASPEFLLAPVCKSLGVNLIGTRMDKHSGKIDGRNCHDEEKVRRFYERYPEGHTEKFYSDSLSDTPMAMIADEAYMLKKHIISPWPK